MQQEEEAHQQWQQPELEEEEVEEASSSFSRLPASSSTAAVALEHSPRQPSMKEKETLPWQQPELVEEEEEVEEASSSFSRLPASSSFPSTAAAAAIALEHSPRQPSMKEKHTLPSPSPSSPSTEYSLPQPWKLTLDMYKDRCGELEREIVQQQTCAAALRIEMETLRTKVRILTECYQVIDEDERGRSGGKHHHHSEEDAPSCLALALRCVEMQAQLDRYKQQSGGGGADGEQIVQKTLNNDVVQVQHNQSGVQRKAAVAPELLVLLKAACRQLEEARRSGRKLRHHLLNVHGSSRN